MESQGFKHAGDEVWYWEASNPLAYKVCKNEPREPENIWCSNSYFFYETNLHWDYLGYPILGQCDHPAPFGSSTTTL